jgi:hypothetical protein
MHLISKSVRQLIESRGSTCQVLNCGMKFFGPLDGQTKINGYYSVGVPQKNPKLR